MGSGRERTPGPFKAVSGQSESVTHLEAVGPKTLRAWHCPSHTLVLTRIEQNTPQLSLKSTAALRRTAHVSGIPDTHVLIQTQLLEI